ncbi:Solute-binding protein family 3 domain-containing protein, MltF-like [Desulfonema limicola]|uniref:Solute-binding protein family 3 domain-containing protein, MltF-like n=1 Tax=Desulfonema limicola TaxID=45656 RepID=A0A975BBK2_9BACT|nr:ABC transporter substrate-binding protein [Desulfonema limicola]QTA82326.1 Solute-binding protein family 3 domain-containing protein, MltF-like [Desulfonema limicola]
MKTRLIVILFLFAQLFIGTNLFAETVDVYGLEAMPFCGVIDGNPVGIAVDVLNEATKHGAPDFKFTFDVPWPRATKIVQESKNELAAIIPFTRSSEREDKFKWVAEIMATEWRFFTYGRISPINSIDEIKDETIGVVHGHAIIPMLDKMGLKIDSGAKTARINALKMIKNRVKIIADSDVITLYSWKEIGQNTKDLQKGPVLGEIKHVFIAAGLNFPDDVAAGIFNAIEKMRNNGELQKIYDKWL